MKYIFILVLIIVIIIIGFLLFSAPVKTDKNQLDDSPIVNNVSINDGKQIIEIRAKDGFTPRKSIAKADLPTVLRFDTNGTFDCSSVVRIPELDITRNLPQSGVTDIDLGNPKVGVLNGTCGMGMYPFEINFQ
jgi:plastocyanin domain-containing protein